MNSLAKRLLATTATLTLLLGYALYAYARPWWVPTYQTLTGKRSVQQVLETYEAQSQERLKPYFEAAKAPYPPSRITLLAIKDEKKLELWTEESGATFFIRAYAIKAASGLTGPKLRQGDQQVPEGIYRLEYLNPNSTYHLSMKINYPNNFDQKYAKQEGRTRLGGDIFIHGKAVSIGCLAMGDKAIEELFTLVARTGTKKVKVILAPSDPRKGDILPLAKNQPEWVEELYKNISTELTPYKIFSDSASESAVGIPETENTFLKKCH